MIRKKFSHLKHLLLRMALFSEYLLIRFCQKSVFCKIGSSPKFKSDIIFLEKSYQGEFRNSNKNDHYMLSRQAFLDLSCLKISVFSIDIFGSRLRRFKNSMRLLFQEKVIKKNSIIVIYFSVQTLSYLNPFVLRFYKKKGLKILCILTDGSWSENQSVTQRFSDCFNFVSCWDNPFFPDLKSCQVIKGSFSPFPKWIECSPSTKKTLRKQ